MTRRDRRRERALARAGVNVARPRQTSKQHTSLAKPCGHADRKALLLGTALASTLLIAGLMAPPPAQAQTNCTVGGVPVFTPPPPGPIEITPPPPGAIDCVNTFDRNNGGTDTVIELRTNGVNEPISLDNSGDLTATGPLGLNLFGIRARTFDTDSSIDITNSGDIRATSGREANGIETRSYEPGSSVTIDNRGDMWLATNGSSGDAVGIDVTGFGDAEGLITIHNSGDFRLTAQGINSDVYGIKVRVRDNSPVVIHNSGDMWLNTLDARDVNGFEVNTASGSPVTLVNSGDIRAAVGEMDVSGIKVLTNGGAITVNNSGDMWLSANGAYADVYGIEVNANAGGAVSIVNSGDISVATRGEFSKAHGIRAQSDGNNSPITIRNSGRLEASAIASDSFGILAQGERDNSPVTIYNSGDVHAAGPLSTGIGIDPNSIYAGPNLARIFNSGNISASSHRAIDVKGPGTAHIYNAGRITGFVDLTAQDDRFINQSGGVFEAKRISDFGDGNDLFVNEAGGTVQAATDATANETTRFIRLETFQNRGLISLVDNRAGDRFTISNTLGGTDLNFVAGSGSSLALDVFLDGPASPADIFTIQGNVSGTTTVAINNTNFGPGTFNPTGIPVIFVDGATPSESNFQLAQPVDTGFFDYDLFFVPTNSGFWELRSFTGAGAFLLPQLVTAAQDIWHQGSNTWFDRTADLRGLLAGGAAPTAYDPGGSKSFEAAGPYPLTPAVWARGSGGWLDRDDSAKTRAYGRNYSLDLDRELTTLDFQVGVDLGKRDVMSDGDALVFGMLGGFVYGGLDYDAIPRSFDFSGGQVGAYATYMNGGLFVDTLLNVHLYELSTATRGFPDSLDANTVGLRTDAGYRFGSFTGGAFLEPLATIEVLWADIDGFSLGGNTVRFDDDANVRGRLGLRAGTTMQAWEGTLMEPFVIGSVWGNLSDDNSATLVSNGRTFSFQDDLEDVWGEISGGVNFFNFSQTTAVFAKVDVTIGDDISGVGGKAGMRVNW